MSKKSDLSSLLEARPELVSTLSQLLDLDADQETWQPADVGIDETAISPLLDEGHVEEVDGGYQFTDRAAVRAALDRHRSEAADGRRRISVLTALSVVLALVVLVRSPTVLDVFRDDWVVLVSNDPYFYRYLVDQSLANGGLPSVPDRVVRGEPLLVATLAVAAWPFGAGTWGSGFVIAWYPVVAAVLTAALVYSAATRLTDDVRVGLAAAGFLAVTPTHAFRTAIGVADHHAFDYLWLSLTLFAVIELLRRSERDRRTWLAGGVLAIGVAAQALAWEAAPLLLFPLAPALALTALVEIRRPGSERLTPVAAGLVGGAIIAHGIHLFFGWQFAAVIYALDLLALGSVGLLGVVVSVRRVDGSWVWLAVGEAVLAVGSVVAIRRFPLLWTELQQGLSFLARDGIAELAGVGSNYGAVGVLVFLGFASVLAVPTLFFAARWGWQRLEPAWLAVGVYFIYFGVLAALQRRFAGELATPAAILGGVGFVLLASWFGLVYPPVPRRTDREDAGQVTTDEELVVPDRTRIALLTGLAGVAVGSGSLYTALMSRRIVITDATYEAAHWIAGYVDEHDIPYPESYVLSKWGRNRVYNYFVNGESASYGYAQRTYEEFLFSTDPDGWHEQFSGRVGFVVTRDLPHLGRIESSTVQATLHHRFGSATTNNREGVGHFRALFAADGGTRKVFRVVPGATIRGPALGDTDRVQVRTDVSIPGEEFEYVRRAPITDGRFEVTVANPGTYRIGEGGRTAKISERMVQGGETVTLEE